MSKTFCLTKNKVKCLSYTSDKTKLQNMYIKRALMLIDPTLIVTIFELY